MAAMAGSIPSTVSRLKFLLPHPSITCKARTLFAIHRLHQRSKQENPLIWGDFRATISPLSAKFSSSHLNSGKSQMVKVANGDDLVILGIETSCDDTAAAVVRGNGEILSQVVASQADLLAQYGGVAPKMAEEAHSRAIDQVTQSAIDKANLTAKDLSAVAVTIGPGLSLCLRGNAFLAIICLFDLQRITSMGLWGSSLTLAHWE